MAALKYPSQMTNHHQYFPTKASTNSDPRASFPSFTDPANAAASYYMNAMTSAAMTSYQYPWPTQNACSSTPAAFGSPQTSVSLPYSSSPSTTTSTAMHSNSAAITPQQGGMTTQSQHSNSAAITPQQGGMTTQSQYRTHLTTKPSDIISNTNNSSDSSSNSASPSSPLSSAAVFNSNHHATVATNTSTPNSSVFSSSTTTPLNRSSHKKTSITVPNRLKDAGYWERRRRNNESARRSRESRKIKEDQIAYRVLFLEQENLHLRTEVGMVQSEIEKLRILLYNAQQQQTTLP